jgi:hypothetical protein
MSVRSGLAMGGVVAAVALAMAGCGSSGTSTPSVSGGTAGGAASSAAPAVATPSWAAGLGSGVTVYGPGSAAPGNGSPEAVVTGVVKAELAGDYTATCAYFAPSFQSECKLGMAAEASASPSAMASSIGTVTNFAVGYVVVHGDQALVGTTGKFCASGSCYTNTNPAALLSSGKSFSALWSEAVGSESSSSAYALAPVSKIGGKWYIYSPSS